MTNAPMLQELANAAAAVTTIALNSLWEDALLVVCVWLLLRAWPGLNAATRYAVWSATLVATVVVPVATTLPFLTTSSPTAAMTGTAVRVPMPMVTHARTAVPITRSNAPAPVFTSPSNIATAALPRLPERFRMTLPLPLVLTLLAVWALLAAVSFVRLGIGLVRLERLKRDALPLPVEYRDAMLRWTEANKGSRPVRLCVSDEIDVPVAVGLFDSMILIPRALLEKLSETEVDQISLHELAHLRRADDWTNGLQRVVIALFAWNPGILFVGAQLDLEREVACDDWVLTLTGLVRPYAMCLTKMAETSTWPHRSMPAPGVFATRKHISLRIERLLGVGRNAATNLSLGPTAVTIAIVGALAFAMQLVAPSVAASVAAAEPTAAAKPTVVAKPTVAVKASPQPVKPKELIRYVRVVTTTTASSPPAPLHPGAGSPSAVAPSRAIRLQAIHVHVPGQTIVTAPVDVDVPAMNVPMPNVAMPKLSHTYTLELQQRIAQNLHVAAAASVAAAGASAAAAGAGVGLGSMHLADAGSARVCTGCDMSGVDWSGRDMHGVSYTGVDLSRSKLQGTNFSGGTFNGVDFSRSELRNASFRNARLTGCDFTKADLTNVDFTGATISGCDFTSAQLPSAQIRAVLNTCVGCDFSHANLSGLDLSGVRASTIDFSHANLADVNLSNAQFTGVDFSDARLSGANLTNSTFTACDLSGVNLTHVDLSKAKMIGTQFSAHASPHP